jgi:hypothetical protein
MSPPYPGPVLSLTVKNSAGQSIGDASSSEVANYSGRDRFRENFQTGSLTGAVHLSNSNAGVLRRAQRGQKPRVEHKGKSPLD